ncbi:MAG TPA: GNAT family N-acetyltransferase [Anaerolineales bacterium]|nr:GNAT family N-acetyltransferase [Anaerolineales bacterium]
MEPLDAPAVSQLITEFDGDLTTRFLVDPYQAIWFGTDFQTLGVVVECEGVDGLVGMGTVRFGEVQFNDERLPFAFLDGLKVKSEFRGQGLGYRIAQWRIQQAREVFGDRCVLATGMLYDNYASHAVAAKWCREFAESALHVMVLPVRSSPPTPLSGMTVREIEPQEYEEFAARQNRFYKDYHLYSPSSVDTISNALGVSAEGRNPYHYFAAIDKNGNLLAGAQTWARGMLKSDTINHPPAPLRVMNGLLHLLPPDFTIRDIAVNGLWYEPGQLNFARFLWESIRWECRNQGTTIMAGFDPRDPARLAITLRPWHQPRPQITLAIHGPEPIDRSRWFFSLGRV